MACIANNDNPSSPSYALLKNNCMVAKLLSPFCFLLCAVEKVVCNSSAMHLHVTFATKVVAKMVLEFQVRVSKVQRVLCLRCFLRLWKNNRESGGVI